ncbi:hypothetical protein CHARACLAT_004090 [Characodon lateralis]|uniref:Secreted protein n=1 Tax=Characodon lateralis TaxID=208331 RepID=A0ABU7DE15_9TELE|nr:hypothetical protein [Characodon lateralis]
MNAIPPLQLSGTLKMRSCIISSSFLLVSPIPQCAASFCRKQQKGKGGRRLGVNRQMPILGTSCSCGALLRKTHDVRGSPCFLKPFKATVATIASACRFPETIFGQKNVFP